MFLNKWDVLKAITNHNFIFVLIVKELLESNHIIVPPMVAELLEEFEDVFFLKNCQRDYLPFVALNIRLI